MVSSEKRLTKGKQREDMSTAQVAVDSKRVKNGAPKTTAMAWKNGTERRKPSRALKA